MTARDWSTADRISDRIVDLVNAEINQMKAADHFEPFQIFAGQMLALMALFQTMPPSTIWPDAMLMVHRDVELCLRILLALPPQDDGAGRPH